jgi:outer membrane receptor protein involved in Fe transport
MLASPGIRSKIAALMLIGGAVMVLCSAIMVQAQTATGGIRGVVTDANGGALPDVKVTARNVATGVVLQITTNREGVFTFSRILPGTYTVSVEAPRFKKQEFLDVEVSIGKDTVVDANLEPGAISEVVTVAGGAEALIEKDTVQISTTFQERKVQELPVNVPGQGLDRIALLTPGVNIGFGNVNSNGVTLSANGNRARSNNFTLDGVDNNDLSIGGPNYFVRNPDVVAEYQVITNNFSAEYGRNQGAVVNIVSKSGTNEYHGKLGWDHLDRKNFDSLTNLERRIPNKTRAQQNPAPNLDNIFTYSVGGPVIKNKIFFFTTGYFRRNPGLLDRQTTSVAPTPAGLQQLRAAFPNNQAIQYYADYSAFAIPLGNPQVRPDVAATTITIGNVTVPAAAVRRIIPISNNTDEYTGRGDANFGSHRFWGRYFTQNSPSVNLGANVNGWTYDNPGKSKQIGGGWTWTATSRLVNEFRFNYSNLATIFGGGDSGGKGQIPHPDQIDQAFTNLSLQFTAANGASLLGVGPATNLPQGRTVTAYQINDTVSMTWGNHQLTFGADIRKLLNNAPFLPNVNGAFTYQTAAQFADNTPQAVQIAFGPATLKYDELDQFYFFQDDWRLRPNLTLILGFRYENTGQPINLLNQITRDREQSSADAFWRQNLPVEARINPKIPTDADNFAPRLGFVYSPRFKDGLLGRLLGFEKTTIRSGYSIAYDATFYNLLLNISTAAPTVFLTSAVFGIPDAAPTGDKVRAAAVNSGNIRFNAFDPRFFNRTTINSLFRAPYSQQWSFGLQRELFRDSVFEARYVATKGVGLFQNINANPLIGNLINGFASPVYYDPAVNPGGSSRRNFPGFPQLFPGVRPQTCVNDPATADNEGICNGRLLPTGLARERINGGLSIYHSLQMRYDSRLSKQLTYGLTYTWSHAIDNTSEVFSFDGGNTVAISQNPLNLTGAERGNSGFDTRHALTANFIWDLPFKSGQKGILGRALGGWQLNGILRIQSGRLWTPAHTATARNPYEDNAYMAAFLGSQSQFRPFNGNPNASRQSVAISDVDACIFYSFCGTTPASLTAVPAGTPIFVASPTGYYLMSDLNRRDGNGNRIRTPVTPNDVRWVVNGPGSATRFGTPFGNVGRNTELGDRLETVDFSVFKTFRVTERIQFQYRLQLQNALNHPNFGIPNNVNLDNLNFYNFQENDGNLLLQNNGRRTISMGLRVIF